MSFIYRAHLLDHHLSSTHVTCLLIGKNYIYKVFVIKKVMTISEENPVPKTVVNLGNLKILHSTIYNNSQINFKKLKFMYF